MQPTHTEVATELETSNKVLTAPIDIGKEKALSLKGQMLEEKHYTLLLDETGVVMTPDGQVLCVLLKNCLQPEFLEAVRPIVRKAACQPVIAGGNRADAAGTGSVQRTRKNRTPSKFCGVPMLVGGISDEDYQRLRPAKRGVFGFRPRTMRGGQLYPCRLTAYSGVLPSELMLMSELAKEVSEAFRCSHVYDRWETQFKKASQTPVFVLKTRDDLTPFTAVTCNQNWRTAAHIDSGDLKHGFGAMCSFGNFEGCDLVFPRYKVAVRYREGDVLLADVGNQVHGNTPLLNPDGTVPKGKRVPERLVCVFYFQDGMDKCLTAPEAEMHSANNGKPSRKKKRKS
jgi:hypothetical protein